MRTLLRIGALALLAASPAAAQPTRQAPPAPGTPRDFRLPDIRTFQLETGLDVTLVPYGALPKATVPLVVRTGNADEAADEVWLADLMGSLMEEGTTSRTAQQVAQEAAGMGGELNVGVGLEETSIGGDVLAEFAPRMVDLIADVVRNPRMPAEELPRLKANLNRNAAQARARSQSLAQERFRAALYPEHAYGRLFPAEGMVDRYTLEQVRDFYRESFGARRSHLYVAGQFDAAQTEAAIRRAFADWAAGTASERAAPHPVAGRAVYLVERPGAVQTTLIVGAPVATNPAHRDFVAAQVTNALLGGSFGSRITRNLRENTGSTYSPGSSLSSRVGDAYWAESADVVTQHTGASLREIFLEIERLRSEPPSAEELRGIQNYLAGTFVLQNSTPGGIIGQLRFMDLHGLDRGYLENYVRNVYAVTPADVQRVAREQLDPARMIIVAVGDRAQITEQLTPFGTIR